MEIINRSVCSQRFSDLANKTVQVTEELVKDGQIEPEERVFCRDKVTLNGPKSRSTQTEYFTKNTWTRALSKILDVLATSDEYEKAISTFSEDLVDQGGGSSVHNSVLLQQFIGRITTAKLESPETIETATHREVQLFLNEYFNEPVPFIAVNELAGIVIETEPIEIIEHDYRFILRQVRAEDFEKERSLDMLIHMPMDPFNSPDAILEIHQDVINPRSLQEAAQKAEALLRLYDVGSVRSIKTYYKSDSYNMMAKSISTNSPWIRGSQEYKVSEIDKDKLLTFWNTFYPILSSRIYDNTQSPDFLSIAYSRYSESLLTNGNFESRIASAVMGLESLFSQNRPEISYSLQKRVAKLFGSMGFNALEVDNLIKETYVIRSKYVHGNYLSASHMRKAIAKVSGIQDENGLLRGVQDLLRIGILFSLVNGMEKDNILDLLDRALIDSDSGQRLLDLTAPMRSLLRDGNVL